MNAQKTRKRVCMKKSGHTLVEIMVVMFLTGLIVAGSTAAFCQGQRLWQACNDDIRASGDAMSAMQKMVSGFGGKPGLRMGRYVPGLSPTTTNGNSRIDFMYDGNSYYFAQSGKRIIDEEGNVLADNIWDLSFAATNNLRPGIVEIKLTYYRSELLDESEIMRLETWVALRNR